MKTLGEELLFKDECYKIIGTCMQVHNELGPGFLEAVYQESLAIEFKLQGIPFEREVKLEIKYKERTLQKFYVADFICYDEIIIELKALTKLESPHKAQVINYLKATDLKLGILINFGANSLQYERIINKNLGRDL